MNGNVYAKTDKGRDEIATRADRLSAKLRNLLLMIDGQRGLDSLPGATDENLAALLQGAYIVLTAKAAVPDAPPPKAARIPKAEARPAAKEANLHDIYSSRFRRS
jgi:hypothetical protein